MSRPLLAEKRITAAALAAMQKFHPDMVAEVSAAVDKYPVVVVGMAQNPVVRKLRGILLKAGIEFHYLEYGSYLSQWRRRLAIKLWSGWPTFPQVFVKGTLIGGCDQTEAALADGSFQKLLGK